MIIIRARPKRFPEDFYHKLHSRSIGPFKIIKKINSNAYIIEFSDEMSISTIFNMADLTLYHGQKDAPHRGDLVVS